jgi:hypothetical protein
MMSTDTLPAQIDKVVSYIRDGQKTRNDVIIGPVVRRPPHADRVSAEWYFVFVHEGEGEAVFTSFGADEHDFTQELRAHLIGALITPGVAFVLHDVDDDLTLVQLAEAVWPSERTRRMHANVRAEMGL